MFNDAERIKNKREAEQRKKESRIQRDYPFKPTLSAFAQNFEIWKPRYAIKGSISDYV